MCVDVSADGSDAHGGLGADLAVGQRGQIAGKRFALFVVAKRAGLRHKDSL
jgi:hypothetical protein